MLRLVLLRHAKSSWDNPALKDFDRPLAARGKLAAERMGAYMARQGIGADLILCSSAVRARQTLSRVAAHLGGKPRTEFVDGLYLAAPAALLSRLCKVGTAADRVMIVGHNPGMHGLAVMLSGGGDAGLLQALAAKFPTAALAVITFEARSWARIAPATGRLAAFMTPKRLD